MLTILLGLVLCVLILLAIPLDVVFRLNKNDVVPLRISIAWGFGLLRTDLGRAKKLPKKKVKKIRSKRTRMVTGTGRAAMAFLRSQGMPARLLQLLRDMLRQLRIRQLQLHLTLGLDDPADTGQLYGCLAPTMILAERMPRVDFHLQPDFSQPILRLSGRGRFRLVPLAFFAVTITFFFSPACWRGCLAAAKIGKQ